MQFCIGEHCLNTPSGGEQSRDIVDSSARQSILSNPLPQTSGAPQDGSPTVVTRPPVSPSRKRRGSGSSVGSSSRRRGKKKKDPCAIDTDVSDVGAQTGVGLSTTANAMIDDGTEAASANAVQDFISEFRSPGWY